MDQIVRDGPSASQLREEILIDKREEELHTYNPIHTLSSCIHTLSSTIHTLYSYIYTYMLNMVYVCVVYITSSMKRENSEKWPEDSPFSRTQLGEEQVCMYACMYM